MEGDDKTDLDTIGIVVISERSPDVCSVIGFLNEVIDCPFDCIVVHFFVCEPEILRKCIRGHQSGVSEKKVRSISPGHAL